MTPPMSPRTSPEVTPNMGRFPPKMRPPEVSRARIRESISPGAPKKIGAPPKMRAPASLRPHFGGSVVPWAIHMQGSQDA